MLNIGQTWLVLNCSAWRDSKDIELRNLLRYVAQNVIEPGDKLIERIALKVDQANKDEKWRNDVFAVSHTIEDLERDARIAEREALKRGFDEGQKEGIKLGIEQGIEQGEGRLGALVANLIADGRVEDAQAAALEPECRAALFAEFGIE